MGPIGQPAGAAVDVVHADDVAAAVEQFQSRGGCRQARGKGMTMPAAFEIGDAAFISEAGRIMAARIFETWCTPGLCWT